MLVFQIFALILSACLTCCVSIRFNDGRQNNLTPTTPENGDSDASVAGTISTYIVEFLSRAIQHLFELFDVKVRLSRFLMSLYTTDNLVLLKKLMNIGLRFGTWMYRVIPNSTEEAQQTLLSLLFPHIDQGGNHQNFPDEVPQDDSKEESSEDVYGTIATTETTTPGLDTRYNRASERNKYIIDNYIDQARRLNDLIYAGRYK
ncbi:hypothetical protein NQ318_016570 [Aromia moschata]|uniref:Uncharacterized protein n=1 Tax=Aromia moschata TaxID=1265417 RepID=A0AAV8YZD8_9CUCU|nr:hypothetical protein NQ318_016570 [Aromia moschata]